MHKIITALLAAALVAGCAGSTVKREVSRGFHWNGIEFAGEIRRTYESDGWTTTKRAGLTVTANGATIISAALDPRNYHGIASGSYNGQPAAATCTSQRLSETFIDITCDISINGQRAGMLRF